MPEPESEHVPTARRLVGMPLSELAAAARNPKEHDLPGIGAAIAKFGYLDVIILDERTNRLVAGHGRVESLRAAKQRGDAAPEGIDVAGDGEWLVPTLRGWSSRSDDDAEAYLIASNRLTEKGGWDERGLLEVLEDLAEAQLLDVTGYEADELATLREMVEDEAAANAGNEERPDKGEALRLAGVTVGEPDYQTTIGEVWQVGRHLLVIADVHQGWALWTPLLLPGDLFWPYPTLLAPFTDQAEEHRCVMVQPNHYLAGWLLTKYHRIAQQPPILLTEAALVDALDVAAAAAGVGEQ